jgi:hypothetical protein
MNFLRRIYAGILSLITRILKRTAGRRAEKLNADYEREELAARQERIRQAERKKDTSRNGHP